MKIDLLVGARPNLVKAAALLHAAKDFPQIQFTLVHTGQHHGAMSDPYFKDLRLLEPVFPCDELTGCTALIRFGQMIKGLGRRYKHERPDAIVVVGDTDSTLAGAIAGAKAGIPVLHVEAGLRNGDTKMQEEINRILVDSIATKHYATNWFSCNNLMLEGKKGIRVGNVMQDTLFRFLPEAREKFSRKKPYAVFTMHRAENIDNVGRCLELTVAIQKISESIPIVWPVHPRLPSVPGKSGDLHLVPPMSYLEFIATLEGAKFVITDSGGVQEEASILGVPCMTLRDNTERPETIIYGTNVLVKPEDVVKQADKFLNGVPQWHSSEMYMAGSAAHRILEDICATL